MKRIPRAYLEGRADRPSIVHTNCPHCGRWLPFHHRRYQRDKSGAPFVWSSVRCPSPECKDPVLIFVIEPGQEPVRRGKRTEVYVHPAPQRTRDPLEAVSELKEFEGRLGRAYHDTIRAYNFRDWNGAAGHAGRVLEGIAKTRVPEAGRNVPLAKLLERLPGQVDLGQPILDVAGLLREGRNQGVHFDDEGDIDAGTATILCDLLDELINYLFVLPQRVVEAGARQHDGGEPAETPPAEGRGE